MGVSTATEQRRASASPCTTRVPPGTVPSPLLRSRVLFPWQELVLLGVFEEGPMGIVGV